MRASEVRISTLKTVTDHFNAIDDIERDYVNTVGGWDAWNSGRTTYLTSSAKKKIAAINARVDRLYPDSDNDTDAC